MGRKKKDGPANIPKASKGGRRDALPTKVPAQRRSFRSLYSIPIGVWVTILGLVLTIVWDIHSYREDRPYLAILGIELSPDHQKWIIHTMNTGKRPAQHLKVSFMFVQSDSPGYISDRFHAYNLPPLIDRGSQRPGGKGAIVISESKYDVAPAGQGIESLLSHPFDTGIIFGVISYSDSYWALPPERYCMQYDHPGGHWAACEPNAFLAGKD